MLVSVKASVWTDISAPTGYINPDAIAQEQKGYSINQVKYKLSYRNDYHTERQLFSFSDDLREKLHNLLFQSVEKRTIDEEKQIYYTQFGLGKRDSGSVDTQCQIPSTTNRF